MSSIKSVRLIGVSLIAAAFPLAGCTLSNTHSAHVQVSMPQTGFRAQARTIAYASPSPSPYVFYGSGGGTSGGGGGDDFPTPTQLSDFNCAAVMVTAPDVAADPVFTQACGPVDLTGSPINVGVFGGFVPTTGGVVDLKVQNGTARTFKLIGVQYKGTVCPSAQDILDQSIASQQVGSAPDSGPHLGHPYLLASVTQDISGDQSIEMTASFTPGQKPAFDCTAGHQGSNGSPVTLGQMSLSPSTSTGMPTFRVVGSFAGNSYGQVSVYSDAACTQWVPSWMTSVGMSADFIVTASPTIPDPKTAFSAIYYVQASNGSYKSACTPVPGLNGQGFQYDPSVPGIQINNPFPGMIVDATTLQNGSFTVSGQCSEPSAGDYGPINLTVNGVAATSCGSCTGSGNGYPGNFSCYVSSISTLIGSASGPIKIGITIAKDYTTGTPTSDDGIEIYKDPYAPGVTLTYAPNNSFVTAANGNVLTLSGTCGAPGNPVNVGYLLPTATNTNPTPLGSTTCNSGAWSASVDMSPAPNGALSISISHQGGIDPYGQYHYSYAGTSITKDSQTMDADGGPGYGMRAYSMTGDGAGTFWVGGLYGTATGNTWYIKRWSGGAWSVFDSYSPAGVSNPTGSVNGIAYDPGSGALYAAGFMREADNVEHWILRRWSSASNAASWGFMDDYYPNAQGGHANAIAIGSSGEVYTAGYGLASYYRHWVVRRFDYNGGSPAVSVVDDVDLQAGGFYESVANAATYVNGALYVAGFKTLNNGHMLWEVRKYAGGPPTIYDYDASPGYNVTVAINGIAVDPSSGTIYVAGQGPSNTWMVASYSGGQWSLMDTYSPQTYSTQQGAAQAILWAGGSLYVAGRIDNGSTDPNMATGYVVRRWNGGASWSQSFVPNASSGGFGALGLYDDNTGLYSCGTFFPPGGGAPMAYVVRRENAFTSVSSPIVPSGKDFGMVNVGSSGTQTFTFQNTGSTDATGVSVYVSGSDFTYTTTCGALVPAGGSCNVSVTYTPAAAGGIAGQVQINYTQNNYSQALSAPLLGSAQLPSLGVLGISPASAGPFVSTYPSGSGQVFTITNSGAGVANNMYLTWSGGVGLSLYSNSCGTPGAPITLAAGGTCTFEIDFNPPAPAVGSQSATGVVHYDGLSGNAQTVSGTLSVVGN